MRKGPDTTTLSVRVTVDQAERIRKMGDEKGFKSTNQFLVSVIEIIAPLVKSEVQGAQNHHEEPVPTTVAP